MPNNGFLTVHTYTSGAQLPVADVTVSVTRPGPRGPELLATRLTDRNGLAGPLTIAAPPAEESQSAGQGLPCTQVDIRADHPDFERILVERVQIFSGISSRQELMLIPVSKRPEYWDLTEVFPIPPQEL